MTPAAVFSAEENPVNFKSTTPCHSSIQGGGTMRRFPFVVAVCVFLCSCSGVRLRFAPPAGTLITISVSGTLKKGESADRRSVKLLVQGYSGRNSILKLVTGEEEPEILFVVSRRMGLVRKPQQETAERKSKADVMEGMALAAMVALPFACEWLPKRRVSLGDTWLATPASGQTTSPAVRMRLAAQKNGLLRLEGVPCETGDALRGIRAVRLLWDSVKMVPRIVEFESAESQKLRYRFSFVEDAE